MLLPPSYPLLLKIIVLFFMGIILLSGTQVSATISHWANPDITESSTRSLSWFPNETCSNWKLVNAPGFGLPSEFDEYHRPIKPRSEKPFQSEEGFEVLVFKDQLYLGMEADNLLGARLWRTRRGVRAPQSQLDWEEVAADSKGLPFGVRDTAQADHIDSLAAFEGWVYASLANRSGKPQGTLVFRSTSGDPGTWQDALTQVGQGFGKAQNENFKDMQIFDGYLCGGTWNEIEGAEVWCTSNGENWTQKNRSGFGDPANSVIWSGHVYEGHLYFGVQSATADGNQQQGRLYRTDSLAGMPIWEEVFRTPEGISWGNILGDLKGYMYLSTPSQDGMVVYRSDSGDSGSWEIASLPGLENDPSNLAVLADGAVTHQGNLYIGVVNGRENFRLWRTNGTLTNEDALVFWEEIDTEYISEPYNLFVQLVSFNDILYAWTSNPVHGQQVWLICK